MEWRTTPGWPKVTISRIADLELGPTAVSYQRALSRRLRLVPARRLGQSSAKHAVFGELSVMAPLSNNRIMQEAIVRDAEVMHGTPVFRGTRVPVQTLFDYIENGDSGFPTVSRELAVQVLEECKELRLARV